MYTICTIGREELLGGQVYRESPYVLMRTAHCVVTMKMRHTPQGGIDYKRATHDVDARRHACNTTRTQVRVYFVEPYLTQNGSSMATIRYIHDGFESPMSYRRVSQ